MLLLPLEPLDSQAEARGDSSCGRNRKRSHKCAPHTQRSLLLPLCFFSFCCCFIASLCQMRTSLLIFRRRPCDCCLLVSSFVASTPTCKCRRPSVSRRGDTTRTHSRRHEDIDSHKSHFSLLFAVFRLPFILNEENRPTTTCVIGELKRPTTTLVLFAANRARALISPSLFI